MAAIASPVNTLSSPFSLASAANIERAFSAPIDDELDVGAVTRALSATYLQGLQTIASGVLLASAAANVANWVSGPQGAVRPYTIIKDPSAWHAADWEGREAEFKLQLTEADVAALEAGIADMQATGKPLEALKYPSDFPLPRSLTDRLAAMKHDILHGRGFAVVCGLPVQRWSEWQSIAAYMGIGCHLGYRGPQSRDGKLVNHVKVFKPSSKDATAAAATRTPLREHNQSIEFSWHTDGVADILSLLCLSQAKEGGESGWASGIAVHNELLLLGRQDLVRSLAGPGWLRDRSRFQYLQPGDRPVWEAPVFSYHDGHLTVDFNPTHYRQCIERYGPEVAPPLTPLQQEAVDMFNEIASSPAFKLNYRLAAGEMAFLKNNAVLHSRSGFVDGETPHQQRHLVRLWLGVQQGMVSPKHLQFPRSYSRDYDRDSFQGLMKPDPNTFHVPLSSESDDA